MSSPKEAELRLEWIPLERITRHAFQPRKAADREEMLHLMTSIDAVGVLHPVLVRPLDGGDYELVSGWRRLQACRKLGHERIPAVVRRMNDTEALQAAVFANTAGVDLHLMEKCESISYVSKVMPDEPPQELAQWFGVSDEFLAVARKLVTLQPVLRESLLGGVLNPAQAIELNRITDTKLLVAAAGRVARDQMTPAQTSLFVEEVLRTRKVEGAEEEEEGGEEIAPVRIVERLYQQLVTPGRIDAESLRKLLRVLLQDMEKPAEEYLDFAYDPAESFYLWEHVLHVARLAMLLGRVRELEPNEVAMLGVCGLLHDAGMIMISRKVLAKTDPLDDEERALIRKHAEGGARLLEQCGLRDDSVLTVVRQHHERGDGSGYPLGLKQDRTHLFSRIVQVADVYEAMVSPRVYKLPVKAREAVRELQKLAAAGALDAETVAAFVQGLGHYPPGTRVRLSNGETGVVIRAHADAPDRPVVRLLSPDGQEGERVRTELDLRDSPGVSITG